MANVKVRLLTSRAGLRKVEYVDVRPAQDEDGNWLYDEDGAHVMEEYVREQLEGWTQSAGEVIEVDAETAARMIEDGQAEPFGRERAEARPKAEKRGSKGKSKGDTPPEEHSPES
jgi:hypothetical protein